MALKGGSSIPLEASRFRLGRSLESCTSISPRQSRGIRSTFKLNLSQEQSFPVLARLFSLIVRHQIKLFVEFVGRKVSVATRGRGKDTEHPQNQSQTGTAAVGGVVQIIDCRCQKKDRRSTGNKRPAPGNEWILNRAQTREGKQGPGQENPRTKRSPFDGLQSWSPDGVLLVRRISIGANLGEALGFTPGEVK